jgi:hypothetical protein
VSNLPIARAIFELTVDHLGVPPADAVHVGDSVLTDTRGRTRQASLPSTSARWTSAPTPGTSASPVSRSWPSQLTRIHKTIEDPQDARRRLPPGRLIPVPLFAQLARRWRQSGQPHPVSFSPASRPRPPSPPLKLSPWPWGNTSRHDCSPVATRKRVFAHSNIAGSTSVVSPIGSRRRPPLALNTGLPPCRSTV